MKYTVIKRFKCKVTHKRYRVGDTYPTNKERGAFLQAAGYLGEQVDQEDHKEQEKQEQTETITNKEGQSLIDKGEAEPGETIDVDSMSYEKLQELAKTYGIKSHGVKKRDLLKALREAI